MREAIIEHDTSGPSRNSDSNPLWVKGTSALGEGRKSFTKLYRLLYHSSNYSNLTW